MSDTTDKKTKMTTLGLHQLRVDTEAELLREIQRTVQGGAVGPTTSDSPRLTALAVDSLSPPGTPLTRCAAPRRAAAG